MTTKRGITFFLSGIFLLCMVSQAQAISLAYDLNGTFNDGGTLMGTIDIDSAGPPYVTDFDLTTAGGSLSGFNYTPGNSFFSANTESFSFIFAGRVLNLVGAFLDGWNPNLGTLSQTYTVDVRERIGFSSRTASNVGAVASSEPASVLILGSGLAGLGLSQYLKNRKI